MRITCRVLATGEPSLIHDTCYVLRRRSYSETSLLLELLTSESRYVHALYRGAKRAGATAIDLLSEYAMSWRPGTALVTIRSCEPIRTLRLTGHALYAALYLNELIRRGLRENQVVDGVHAAYCEAVARLENHDVDLDVVLRTFEKRYLRALGFELVFHREQANGTAIAADCRYLFDPMSGFCLSDSCAAQAYSGRVLLAISVDEYALAETRQAAKIILRDALHHHLGERALKAQSLLTAKRYREAVYEAERLG